MGDGGALTLNDEQWMQRSKRLRWLGIDKGTWDRTATDKSYWWQYFVDEIGLKCHLNDIAAAIGLVQLRRLEAMNARRREIARRYTEAFAALRFHGDAAGRHEPTSSRRGTSTASRRRSATNCAASPAQKGIATGVHYTPIHLYSCYGNRPRLPQAEEVFQRIVSLPMYPGHDRRRHPDT